MTDPSVVNRKTIRKFLAKHLQTYYGSTVRAVYDYQKYRLDKQSPVVNVVSGESDRVTSGIQLVTTESELHFYLHIFVRYQDSESTPPYTEEQSEDLIDDLDAATANFVLLYGDNTDDEKLLNGEKIPWLHLVMAGPSDIDATLEDGIDYRHETVHLVAGVGNIS